MILYRPLYTLSSELKWCTKFKNDKKILSRLRNRAIKAFEYSIKDENVFNARISGISVEIIERYWAARYPECVQTPLIKIYDLEYRGSFGINLNGNNNNSIGILTNLQRSFVFSDIRKGYYRFTKKIIESAFGSH